MSESSESESESEGSSSARRFIDCLQRRDAVGADRHLNEVINQKIRLVFQEHGLQVSDGDGDDDDDDEMEAIERRGVVSSCL